MDAGNRRKLAILGGGPSEAPLGRMSWAQTYVKGSGMMDRKSGSERGSCMNEKKAPLYGPK